MDKETRLIVKAGIIGFLIIWIPVFAWEVFLNVS